MKTYYISEGRFIAPGQWLDQTINIFATPARPPHEFSFVISRQPLPAGVTINAHVDEQMQTIAATLAEFKRLRRHETRVDNLPAIAVEFTWRGEQGSMRQHLTYVIYEQVALTFTATALEENFGKYDHEIERLLLTFKFGQ